jgi:DNA segregation ATPase FtsK/SpoIIIE, S-DNA-T family
MSWFELQRKSLAQLQQLVKARAEAEKAIPAEADASIDAAQREHQRATRLILASKKKADDERDGTRKQEEITLRGTADRVAAEAEVAYGVNKRRTEEQFKQAEETLKGEYKDRLWTVDSLLEAAEKDATDTLAELTRTADNAQNQLDDQWTQAETRLASVNLIRADAEFPHEKLHKFQTNDAAGKVEKCLEDTQSSLDRLNHVLLPKLTGLVGTMWCVFIAGAMTTAVMLLAFKLEVIPAVGVGALGAIGGGLLLRQLLYWLARKQVKDRGTAFGVFAAEAHRSIDFLRSYAKRECDIALTRAKDKHVAGRKETDDTFRPRLASVVKQSVTTLAKLDREAKEDRQNRIDKRNADQANLTLKFDQLAGQQEQKTNGELAVVEQKLTDLTAQANSKKEAAWHTAVQAWNSGIAEVREAVATLKEKNQHFPVWDELTKHGLSSTVPEGIRFGDYTVEQAALPDGVPTSTDFDSTPIHETVPGYLPFPDHSAVLLKARDAGRKDSIALLQAAMLRMLTALPPGKVRFTIIDPVGLGENFAAFMHLADTDPLLVSDRIWTEPSQIETKLSDLTEHMENVIQKYLRNQYKSIEEYNRAAGEVAEPYRVLVVANFPANFTVEAANRLVSIMSSGPACGVCSLVAVDTAATLPRDFRLQNLEQVSFTLQHKDGQFRPKSDAFGPYPLSVDAPPEPKPLAALVKQVGEASRFASRVQVPFDFIAPPPEKVWTGSTKHGFDIPIGRSGATRRRNFILGRGTAQHALVAGKTGSGKSTLLHALLTNLALLYSPDEAEVYLIDFKEGVEFKMYATLKLPQARVVAIESEREFGLSVLQRLDGVLKERGDEFRKAGVNDVASYRDAKPNAKLPRILLVIDEFQMLFVEDDKLGQEAAQILDRLVRQGRAFGVHVLLGSQTIGGSYSLPRSTIDQMAVRIALQCSEADAQLILSKDNTAARLLTRPGEAIYNDTNGMLEGNDPFQVVWCSEELREQKLKFVAEKAGKDYAAPLVFEGSSKAEPSGNRTLAKLLATPSTTLPSTTVTTLWLGESVSIKDPTAAKFRAQSGANLLLVGQAEESALGIFGVGMLSAAAQWRDGNTVMILDGTPEESDLADTLPEVAKAIQAENVFIERYQMAEKFGELAALITKRQAQPGADVSPRFLFINGLQRFRELKKPDDDYGFGRKSDKPLSPAELFAQILREGPTVGVHTVVWIDTVTNLNRYIDRAALREFTMRVLFPMNANDSSQLIDTPAASRLKPNRGLYLEEGQERPESFRPYGLCGPDWLQQVHATLQQIRPTESSAAGSGITPMTSSAIV